MEGRKKGKKELDLYPFMERAYHGNAGKSDLWFTTNQKPD
jgi:hypothetical protein